MRFDFTNNYKKESEDKGVNEWLVTKTGGKGDIAELATLSHPTPSWLDTIKEENSSNPSLKKLVHLAQEGEAVGLCEYRKWSFILWGKDQS